MLCYTFELNKKGIFLVSCKPTLKVIKVSKLNIKRFSNKVCEAKLLVGLWQKTIIGRNLQKINEYIIVVLSRNLQYVIIRPLLNIFNEIWYNSKTSLIPVPFQSTRMLLREPRTINFKQICISNLPSRKFKNKKA